MQHFLFKKNLTPLTIIKNEIKYIGNYTYAVGNSTDEHMYTSRRKCIGAWLDG